MHTIKMRLGAVKVNITDALAEPIELACRAMYALGYATTNVRRQLQAALEILDEEIADLTKPAAALDEAAKEDEHDFDTDEDAGDAVGGTD